MTHEDTEQPTYHVLLIGIDAYQSRPLKGCVQDIDSIQRLLIDRAGVPASAITRLVSPHPAYVPDTTVAARAGDVGEHRGGARRARIRPRRPERPCLRLLLRPRHAPRGGRPVPVGLPWRRHAVPRGARARRRRSRGADRVVRPRAERTPREHHPTHASGHGRPRLLPFQRRHPQPRSVRDQHAVHRPHRWRGRVRARRDLARARPARRIGRRERRRHCPPMPRTSTPVRSSRPA